MLLEIYHGNDHSIQDLCLVWNNFKSHSLIWHTNVKRGITREKNKVKTKWTMILLSPHVCKRKKKYAQHQFKQIWLRERVLNKTQTNSNDEWEPGNETHMTFTDLEVTQKQEDSLSKSLFTRESELQWSHKLLRTVQGVVSNVNDLNFRDETIIETIDSMSEGKAPWPDTVPVELWKPIKLDMTFFPLVEEVKDLHHLQMQRWCSTSIIEWHKTNHTSQHRP